MTSDATVKAYSTLRDTNSPKKVLTSLVLLSSSLTSKVMSAEVMMTILISVQIIDDG